MPRRNLSMLDQETCPCQEVAKSVALIHVAVRASQGHSGEGKIESEIGERRDMSPKGQG
jgi:hypothetical protein